MTDSSFPLVVFDIDGTLTHTTGIDDSSFVAAVCEVLRIEPFAPDWANYEHVTDGGLLLEASRRFRQRDVTADETHAVKDRFFAMIAAHAAVPGRITQVPGAAELLKALVQRGWAIALSTGAWRESARLKLVAAGLGQLITGPTALPAAFADEAISRADIAMLAIRRAGRDPSQPRRIVYIGDGVWDVRTSRGLGLGFVGVRVGGDLERLREEGARNVVKDFSDLSVVMRLIDREIAEGPVW